MNVGDKQAISSTLSSLEPMNTNGGTDYNKMNYSNDYNMSITSPVPETGDYNISSIISSSALSQRNESGVYDISSFISSLATSQMNLSGNYDNASLLDSFMENVNTSSIATYSSQASVEKTGEDYDYNFFGDFCRNIPVWSEDTLSGEVPNLSECFQTTIVEWVPFLWLFICIPWYLVILKNRRREAEMPITVFSIAKSTLSFAMLVLSCVQIWSVQEYGPHCDTNIEILPSYYLGITLRCISLLTTTIFIQYVRIRGVVSSVVLTLYWAILLCGAFLHLQANIISQPQCTDSIVHYVYFSLLCIQLFLHCFADRRGSGSNKTWGDRPSCPITEASCVNHLYYAWFTPMVLKAYKETLNTTDLWDQTPSLQCKITEKDISDKWRQEIAYLSKNRTNRPEKSNKSSLLSGEETPLLSKSSDMEDELSSTPKPSLYKIVFKQYCAMFFKGCFLKIACLAFMLLQPLIMSEIIAVIAKGDESPRWWALFLAVMMFAVGLIESLIYNQAFYVTATLGLKMKAALIGVIYRKSLRLSNTAKKNYTVGEIVNLMSVDCQRILDAMPYSFQALALIIGLLIGVLEIWDAAGISFLGIIGMLILMAILGIVFGKLVEIFQQVLLNLKGKRLKLLSEVLNGIKVLKMYTWEPVFAKKIKQIRWKEWKLLRKIAHVNAWAIVVAAHSPFMMGYFIFLMYTLLDLSSHLSSDDAFLIIAAVNILRYEVALIPFNITGFIQLYVSIGRIQQFLWEDELSSNAVDYVTSSPYAVSIEDGNFSWNKDQETDDLKGIDLHVEEGSLVAVVGPVGCGKSSLVSAILGELQKNQGKVTVKGSVAYVPQEAWIQNLTLRENVLYGRRYKEKKYEKVIEACALKPDLAILSAGDMTEIGQKGTNLSGGQKQRVSLARAVFSNSDIYLMDDPLSAVDAHVGTDLFQNVIGKEGLLKNKTRILVTHGVRWLPKVDTIIVMDDGRIREMGSYKQLLESGGHFAHFLQTYLMTNELEDGNLDQELNDLKRQMFTHSGYFTSDDDTNLMDSLLVRKRRNKSRSSSTSMPSVHQKKALEGTKEGWRLIQDESVQEGKIRFSVIKDYVKALGVCSIMTCYIALAIFQALNVFSNYWMTYWTEDELLLNTTLSSTQEYRDRNIYYLVVYSILGILQGVILYVFGILAMLAIVRATQRLHNNMVTTIVKSPMSFFDTTPMGRVINRFSSDVDLLDSKMPDMLRVWSIMFANVLSTVTVIVIQIPISIVALVPIGVLFYILLRFYLPTARQMKRLESVTRSPVYNHFSETITGASVIRSYRSVDRFIEENQKRVDHNTSFYHGAILATRWIGVTVETLTNVLVFVVAVFSVVSTGLNGGDVGIMLTYAIQVVIGLIIFVETSSEMEMNLISAERIIEYTNLPSEAALEAIDFKPTESWPEKGVVEFRNFATRYRPGLDLVLKDVNCKIFSGEKVGVVGRTGAGKSSLTLSLFRLIESVDGGIIIDGARIANLGLHDLRKKITILPQDPVLFSGSLKSNLDPTDIFSDADIWKALECAHLKNFVSNHCETLQLECGEGGQNLSVGQRQLVCLGRALLHKNRILILDEATAAVDMETDELIQETIRNEFGECTVITVAHRLNTIMDYDRVMVLDKGKIVEFDRPQVLLEDNSTIFHGMAKDADLVGWFEMNMRG